MKIHLILNAHIDPIWLWPWSAGLDEILNTCETTCDILERNPDVIFSRGEAWVYEIIQKLHPALFRRIRRLIARGQWEIVGGWFIQPDCNLPSGFALEKQIALGKAYFEKTFRQFPKTAYNVDSFGHSAALPDIMARAGQTQYVMMRPMTSEKKLPARLFRWRGHPGGHEIVTFRISEAYCHAALDTMREHLEGSLRELPPGVDQTMCFVGVGDHGGGPTEELITFLRENREAIPGARLEFSSPARYFASVQRYCATLPLVTGELQMHAPGCYSVHRSIKRSVRRAEHLLAQAGEALRQEPELVRRHENDIETGWRWACFHQFHDTLCGTCLPSAYEQVDSQIGWSKAAADEVLQYALRRRGVRLPPERLQRIIVGNYAGTDFDGWLEHDPWLEWTKWQKDWKLIDEKGREIPIQLLESEANGASDISRLLFRLKVKRGSHRVLRIAGKAKPPASIPRTPHLMVGRRTDGNRVLVCNEKQFPAPVFRLIEDRTDTWSHNAHCFEGKTTAVAQWGKPRQVDAGPLLNSWCIDGRIGKSSLKAEWRAYADASFLELRLRVHWLETWRILRLAWNPGEEITGREEGISEKSLWRKSDGDEYQVHDWTLLSLRGGKKAGILLPDTYSLSCTRKELRLTLLRSAIMAHHDPSRPNKERRVVSDQGPHSFFFRFYPAGTAKPDLLKADALAFHRPPLISDLTRGMPWRPIRNQIERPL